MCWELACERQVHRLREKFFTQILRQNIAWHESNDEGSLTTKLSEYVLKPVSLSFYIYIYVL